MSWMIGEAQVENDPVKAAVAAVHQWFASQRYHESFSKEALPAMFDGFVKDRWNYGRGPSGINTSEEISTLHAKGWLDEGGLPEGFTRQEIIDGWVVWRKLPLDIARAVIPDPDFGAFYVGD